MSIVGVGKESHWRTGWMIHRWPSTTEDPARAFDMSPSSIEDVALNHLPARQGAGLESNRPERAGDISNGKALSVSLNPSKPFQGTTERTIIIIQFYKV
jgi:hypothetical protein